jgi:hypothetical protein
VVEGVLESPAYPRSGPILRAGGDVRGRAATARRATHADRRVGDVDGHVSVEQPQQRASGSPNRRRSQAATWRRSAPEICPADTSPLTVST